MIEWPGYKVKILKMARAVNSSLLREADGNTDDGALLTYLLH